MGKAERIVAWAQSNPFLSIKDLATEFSTCPAQSKGSPRYGLYEERKIQKRPLGRCWCRSTRMSCAWRGS
jgi:hypothetical protein